VQERPDASREHSFRGPADPLTEEKTMKKRYAAFAGTVAAIASVSIGIVFATAPSGIDLTRTAVVARGSFVDAVDLKFKIEGQEQQVITARDVQETVMQRIVIAAGGDTGWHSHPGPVVVLVTAGALTLYSAEGGGCASRTYTAGQAFIDSGQGHVHIARNEGSTDLELWVTYFDVPPGGPFRLDAADPGTCSF
jgi:quercetin dioxygenase-like cupin family protein